MNYTSTNSISYETLLRAGERCCNGSRWKSSVQSFEMTLIRQTAKSKKNLDNGKFKPRKTSSFMLRERGKWREIKSHKIIDRQVYKAFCDTILKPSMANRILESNSASQVGKGTEHSIKMFRQGLAKAYRKWGRDFYVVTYDFHNYFGSIPHDQILQATGIHDEFGLFILKQYIDLFDNGIGIGGEPSQDIAVCYPSKIDRMLACNKRVLASGRYMDDGYAICHTREDARHILASIRRKSDALGLVINGNRTRISYMAKDSVVWLKKRTRLTETGKIIMQLTRKNVRDELRNIEFQKRMVEKGDMPMETALVSLVCWVAYAKKYNSNAQVCRVIEHFEDSFGIPAKKLLRRRSKGWITESRSKIS